MPRSPTRPFIDFGGRRYYQDTDLYFKTSRTRGGPKARLLHRDIYAATHGPIPPGQQVHHRDLDRENNDPGNLEALTVKDHAKHHPRHGASEFTAEQRAANQRAMWAKREPREVVCVGCGQPFSSTGMRAMFCGRACRRRYYHREPGH